MNNGGITLGAPDLARNLGLYGGWSGRLTVNSSPTNATGYGMVLESIKDLSRGAVEDAVDNVRRLQEETRQWAEKALQMYNPIGEIAKPNPVIGGTVSIHA